MRYLMCFNGIEMLIRYSILKIENPQMSLSLLSKELQPLENPLNKHAYPDL